MENQQIELRDYVEAAHRRWFPVVMIAVATCAISLVLALSWPPTYRSKAIILVEEQDIPADLVRSTVTSYASQRIHSIKQQIMTRANLTRIIEKFDLYPNQRDTKTSEQLVNVVRDNITLEIFKTEGIEASSGRPGKTATSFSLSFDASQPEVAQQVSVEITDLFLHANVVSRTRKVTETSDFLRAEADRLEANISELETRLQAFKQQHANYLPELLPLNMKWMDKAEKEFKEAENRIRVMNDRKFYLQGQLHQVNPLTPSFSASGQRVMDAASKLKVLRADYLSASSRLTPTHPERLRLEREIKALENQTGLTQRSIEQAEKLASLRAELSAAKLRYSPQHPEVARLNKMVDTLANALIRDRSVQAEVPIASENPENPAYIGLKTQLQTVNSELMYWADQRRQAQAKQEEYEQRILQSPQVEREYLTLTREHDQTLGEHREINSKLMKAQVRQSMEQGQYAERFTMIEPPQLPEQPIKPNRKLILFLGILFSLVGVTGYVVIAEAMDDSIRGAKGIYQMFGSPPLAVIPFDDTVN